VSLPEDEELPPGTTLGGFEIKSVLGSGGMGNVYLATQLSMQREIALKVLPKVLTQDKDAVEQFLNEVRMTGRLEHPHIVTAIDAGEENGTYFLAMTYVNGEDLEERIERLGLIPEKYALKYVQQIAEALEYALTRHDLIHRDIKPGNIIVNEDEGAFLLDMGIAQQIGEAPNGNTEHIEGSPFYMSPSDQYSLGATLYHMVVGVPPFDHKDIMRIVEMHTDTPMPDPKKRNPESDVSPETVKLIKKMMGKTPNERFHSWNELQKRIKTILRKSKKSTRSVAPRKSPQLTHQGISHRKSSRKMVVVKKRRPLFALINTLIVLGILSGAAFFGLKLLIESKAKRAYVAAMKYSQSSDFDCEYALELFYNAENAVDNFMVGSSLKKEITRESRKHRAKLEALKREKREFNKTFDEAAGLYASGAKMFKEKRYGKALQYSNKALAELKKVKPPTKLDKERYDTLVKNQTILKKRLQYILNKNKRKR
jgi:serine/threonine-protein kinase